MDLGILGVTFSMSLRVRLLLALGFIALVALVLADVATYSALKSFLFTQADQNLTQSVHRGLPFSVDRLTGDVTCFRPGGGDYGLGGNRGPGGPTAAATPGVVPNAIDFEFAQVRTSSGTVVSGLSCPAYVDGHAYTPQLPTSISGLSVQPDGSRATFFTTGSVQGGGPAFRVRASNGTNAIELPGDDLLVLATPIGQTTNTLNTLFTVELIVTAGALIVALLGGWWLVRLGLRPLADVERTAASIADGNLDQRVPGANSKTEVGRLAWVLNVMLARLEVAFGARLASEARLKEFVADASHELRTPIAAVSAYAELFERGAAQNPDDLSRVLSGIRTETVRMNRLVNDLLTLARLDEHAPPHVVPIELVGLVAEAVRTAAIVAPEWHTDFSASEPVEVNADPLQLRQVLDNLLANIRSHTPEGTKTIVRVEKIDGSAQIVVTDNGPGMDPGDAERIFERFYRADPARARTHGGTGLGLSIVSAIVGAHGGTVSASSAPGQGLSVTLRLPASEDLEL